MSNDLNGQELIAAFFAALELRNLEQCEAEIAKLQLLSLTQPAYVSWCTYFEGILANERDHDWAKAERIFSQLLQDNLNPTLRIRVLLALGRTYDLQGRWAEAIQACERSLPISAELHQPTDRAKALKQIAISYRRGFARGDFDATVLQQAIDHCRSALAVLEPIVNSDIAWLKGSIWNTLGLIYRSLGQWDEAIASYEQDLAFCLARDDHFGMGITYGNLGEIYQKRSNWPEALNAYQQALIFIRESKGRYEEIDVLANLAYLYQEMDEYERALDYYSQTIQLIENLRTGISSEEARASFFATIVDTYANAVLLCRELGHEVQAFDYVEQARSRAFLDLLATRTSRPDLSQKIEATTMTLAEVQAALPPDAVLLEYFTTGLIEAQEEQAVTQKAERHRFPTAKTLIFAVIRDQLQVHEANFSPNDLRPRQLDSVVERHFLKPQIRRTLYDQLIAPIAGLLQGKRRLYLIPHGPLHYIPFQALIAPDGETLLRDEGPQLVYAPSATLLLRYRPQPAQPHLASCLAIGYNSEGEGRLYFAEEEAHSIARLMEGHVLTGPTPKIATLYSQAADYRLLHLACHGEFDPESPLTSFLHLAPGEMLTGLDVLEHLNLRCDLVTLSACESGLSRVRRGDELMGLMRAFIYAGTPALISTLWRVNDRPTRILMEKFYQEIHAGTGFAEALKQAQLYVKNLSYQEALSVLTSLAEDQTDDTSALDRISPDRPRIGISFHQATTYLRGVATQGQSGAVEPLVSEPEDEKVFADPYYWAPFILVGDHGSGMFEEA